MLNWKVVGLALFLAVVAAWILWPEPEPLPTPEEIRAEMRTLRTELNLAELRLEDAQKAQGIIRRLTLDSPEVRDAKLIVDSLRNHIQLKQENLGRVLAGERPRSTTELGDSHSYWWVWLILFVVIIGIFLVYT